MGAYTLLELHHFRSYTEHTTTFEPGVNVIVGPNGSGKTNLLEALYVLSHGTSFRGIDRDMVSHGNDWFRLQAVYNGLERTLTCKLESPSVVDKQFTLDGVKRARLSHTQRVPVVLFEPEHLRLLRDAPSQRRDYLDTLLIKLQTDYSWLKHQFERVLLQRNNVLKRRLPPDVRDDQLFAWDISFADLAEQIASRRRELVTLIDTRMSAVYSKIAQAQHAVQVRYEQKIFGEDYRATLLAALQATVQHDSDRGFTTVGPHRDELVVLLDGVPALAAASRGEMRSLLLALKIIELELVAEQSETTPLLLLDDVFSELDTSRRRALASLAQDYQTLITTTDADAVVGHFLDGYHVIATHNITDLG
ncbi:MAG TPA: DNA replication/repair protein RecF [Magnetospirillaceae bacterium]|nr:DNA replication/repair protein RecF [Magnetospirillaceae bacterium]